MRNKAGNRHAFSAFYGEKSKQKVCLILGRGKRPEFPSTQEIVLVKGSFFSPNKKATHVVSLSWLKLPCR